MRINTIDDLISALEFYGSKDLSPSQKIDLQFLENKYNYKYIEYMIDIYSTDYIKKRCK